MIGAGELRWKIRFDKRLSADNPSGGTIDTWSNTEAEGSFFRQAAIKPQYGSEQVQQQRMQGVQPSLIFVRFDSKTRVLDGTWRAVEMLNGEPVAYYAIKTASDIERKRAFVTIQAVQGAADGGAG